MNIFVLDEDPRKAAEYHCDRHVVKMIIESVQLLSTGLHLNGYNSNTIYKITHKNHPCAIWTRESQSNYLWLCELTYYLLKEYTKRYGKEHQTISIFEECLDSISVIPVGKWTPWVYCGPILHRVHSIVESYRQYYRVDKSRFATWKNTVPSWYTK